MSDRELVSLAQLDERLAALTSGECVAMIVPSGDRSGESTRIGSPLYAIVMVFRDERGACHARWHLQMDTDMGIEGMQVLFQGIGSLGQAALRIAMNLAGSEWRKVWNLVAWIHAN